MDSAPRFDFKLRSILSGWLGPEIVDTENSFLCLLSSIGIFPLFLKVNRAKENEILCTTTEKSNVLLVILGSGLEVYPQLKIVSNYDVKIYNYIPNFGLPHLELDSVIIRNVDKKLTCCYSDSSFYCYHMELGNNTYVSIYVKSPPPLSDDKIYVSHAGTSFESFLSTLSYPCTAQEIYKNFISSFNLRRDEMQNITKISVEVRKQYPAEKEFKKKELIETAICVERGKVVLYVINKKGVSYGADIHGGWFFETPYILYRYSIVSKRILVRMNLEEKQLLEVNPQQLLEDGKKEIESIKHHLGKLIP